MAEKLFKLPANLQRQKLINLAAGHKEQELKQELELHHLKAATKELYRDRLVPTAEEIASEESRLQALVSAVECGEI